MTSNHDLNKLETEDTSVNVKSCLVKVMIVGNWGVGKTAFLLRYCDKTFTSSYMSTVGVDLKTVTLLRKDKRIILQIWDTAGQERYLPIVTPFFRGVVGFILMFDLTNNESFLNVKQWSAKIKDKASEKAQMVLVGSKSDLTGSRVITKEQGEELAQSLGVEYFETSAREDVNVKQTFETLVDLISEKIPEAVEEDLDTVPKDIQLGQPEVKTKKSSGCCCEYCRK